MSSPIRIHGLSPATFSKVSGHPTLLSGSPRLSSAPATPPSSTKLGCHSPYAAVVLRSSDSSKVASPISLPPSAAEWDAATRNTKGSGNSSDVPPPPAYSSGSYHQSNASSPAVPGVHTGSSFRQARRLSGRAQFLRLDDAPQIHCPYEDSSVDLSSVPMQHPYELPTLFLGQLKYEVTPTQVAHIIEHFAGVRPLRVEYRPKGCAMVFLKSPEDASAVKSLHKRLLFDYSGVWFASNDAQRCALEECAAVRLERLPNDCVSVEEPRNRPQYTIMSGHVAPFPFHGSATSAPMQMHPPYAPPYTTVQSAHSAQNFCPPPPSYSEATTSGQGTQRNSGNDHSLGPTTAPQSLASTPRHSQCASPLVRPRGNSDQVMSSSPGSSRFYQAQ